MFYGIPEDKRERFDQAVNDILSIFPGYSYAGDMMITLSKNLTFAGDSRFMTSFNSAAKSDQEKSLLWRLHVLAWAASHAIHIPGDFVECGVLHGFASAVVCNYLDFAKLPKTFYLYDTFAGLPAETFNRKRTANVEHQLFGKSAKVALGRAGGLRGLSKRENRPGDRSDVL